MKYEFCFILLFVQVFINFNSVLAQWPKVENLKKSKYLPSLEVRVHPPDEFQPKVQAEIRKNEEAREKNERKYMQDLENAYNDELVAASEKIEKIISEGLSIFDDDNLLSKSVEYAVNPPIVVFSSTQTNEQTDQKGLTPSFKEVANITMNKLQKRTMDILVEDDLKIEKLRHPKIMIFKEKMEKPNKSFLKKPALKNGPIALDDNLYFFSFLESSFTLKGEDAKYSKPIAVKMKMPSEPDPKIQKEISKMEKKREKYEKKMFDKAKQEFKLITSITIKELQINLQHELIPYFVVSKKSMDKINEIVDKHVITPQARFLQIDKDEISKRFPSLGFNNSSLLHDQNALNQYTYQKVLSLFSNVPLKSLRTNSFLSNNNAEKKFIKNLKQGIKSVIKQKKTQATEDNSKESVRSTDDVADEEFKKKLDYDEETCKELSSKLLKNLANISFNCSKYSDDYNILKKEFRTLYSSFLEMNSKEGDDEFINVKLGANDDTYPTIEKLVAQMMNRRDLSEKFERLKILEFETHLQKAENEMIQDVLHEKLYKIMAKFGPAIEGVKEHIK